MKKAIVISAVISLMLLAANTQAYGDRVYKLVMPLATGLSMGSTGQIVKDIGKALEKNTGQKFEANEFRYTRDLDVPDTIAAMFKKGDADFVLVSARDYLFINKRNPGLMKPFAAITFFGKPTTNVCVYTRKADGIKTVQALKGKVWGGTAPTPMRYILYKNGVNTPLNKFFSKTVFVLDENVTNVLNALIDKKIDVFALQSLQFDMAKNADKKYSTLIESSNCMEYEHSWLLTAKKDVPADMLDKVKQVFITAHKNKDFAQFKFLFTAIKGNFIPYDPAKMKTTEEIFSLINKYGWQKEEDDFIKSGVKKTKK